VGAVLLLVLLAGAALAPAAAAPVAAVAPDLIDSAVFEHDSSKDSVPSTSPAEGVGDAEQPVTAEGRVMTTGDHIMGTDALRAYGITGRGVKIGVISDGVNGAAASQTSRDLGWVTTISDEDSIGGGEGTAMLEIIHDIAPGAALYFHDRGENASGFTRAVDALVAAGCTVIVDDIGYFDEPFFEKGDAAAHLERLLTTQRLIYVTSAGNFGDAHWQGPVTINNEGLQDFSGVGSKYPYLYALVPRGEKLTVALQWDEPVDSAKDDFDIGISDFLTGVSIAPTVYRTSPSDPYKLLYWENPDVNNLGHVVTITVAPKGSTANTQTLELYTYGAAMFPDNVIASDSIWGHASIPDVITVAAINASSPDTIESFSSHGPATYLLPNCTIIQKPDISAPDYVNVTGYRFHTPFKGTSAAAPHIAALCALVWSVRQDLSPADIRSALYASAVDLGTPGYDNVFGWGGADAVTMYNLLATGKPVNTDPPSAFKKFYPKGGPSSGSIGGTIIRRDTSIAMPGSPVDLPTTSPKKPPAKQFVRWYPGEN